MIDMTAETGKAPLGYRAVPILAWSAAALGVVFPIVVALVLAAYPHSVAVLCAAREVPGALVVVAAGLVRYGRSVLDSTRTWTGARWRCSGWCR
jgi:hypothetical protein